MPYIVHAVNITVKTNYLSILKDTNTEHFINGRITIINLVQVNVITITLITTGLVIKTLITSDQKSRNICKNGKKTLGQRQKN